MIDKTENIGHTVGPAEEYDAGEVQLLHEFVDIAGVTLRVIPFWSFLGISLRTGIESDDVEVGRENINLGLEDFCGHGPAGDEDDGRGLRGAGVEIVEGDVVGRQKGLAFGVDGCDRAGGKECEIDESQSGSHEDGNFSRILWDSGTVGLVQRDLDLCWSDRGLNRKLLTRRKAAVRNDWSPWFGWTI